MTADAGSAQSLAPHAQEGVWNVAWLTPARCRAMLLAVLLIGFAYHLFYLTHNCPITLSGDEAQYWDWSRRLDLSYYSKGPLIAYIIRASCGMFGDTMPAVRYPALVLGAGTLTLTYTLTRKLFYSDRLALGAVLLNHLVPVLVAGSILMTIDSPLFFCWGLATYLAASAIFENKRWAWPLIGLVVGIGALGKYAMLLWLPIIGGFLLMDASGRRILKTAGPWIATAIALACMTPVVIWNQRHDWVSLRHVAHQTGAAGGALSHGNLIIFLASQLGIVGPTIAVIMVAALIAAIRHRNDGEEQRRTFFLAFIGIAFFAFNLLASLMAKVQVNWPAPAYFTLTILCTHFLGDKLKSFRSWLPWRGWFYASVIIGLLFLPIAHDSGVLIAALGPIARRVAPKYDLAKVDLARRLRGWDVLGQHLNTRLQQLHPGAFVLCDDYQQTAEAAFYMPGQPQVYCAGPYSVGKRLSQYDMWPDHRLDHTSPLVGHDAIYVGKGGGLPGEISAAFDRVERVPDVEIPVHGVVVHTFYTWRCYGFHGFDPLSIRHDSDAY